MPESDDNLSVCLLEEQSPTSAVVSHIVIEDDWYSHTDWKLCFPIALPAKRDGDKNTKQNSKLCHSYCSTTFKQNKVFFWPSSLLFFSFIGHRFREKFWQFRNVCYYTGKTLFFHISNCMKNLPKYSRLHLFIQYKHTWPFYKPKKITHVCALDQNDPYRPFVFVWGLGISITNYVVPRFAGNRTTVLTLHKESIVLEQLGYNVNYICLPT